MVIVKSVYYFLYQFLEKVMSAISGDREQKQEVGGGGGGGVWDDILSLPKWFCI